MSEDEIEMVDLRLDNHRSQHHLDQDEQIRLNLQKYSEYKQLKSLGHNSEAAALLAPNEPKIMSENKDGLHHRRAGHCGEECLDNTPEIDLQSKVSAGNEEEQNVPRDNERGSANSNHLSHFDEIVKDETSEASTFLQQSENTNNSKYQDFLHPRTKHYGLILNFFVFSVVLVSADIISDIATAMEFFSRGDISWGSLTTLFVFSPFLANLVIFMTKSSPKKKCFEFYTPDIFQLIWNFPFFHPLRNMRTLIAMFLMDTNLPQNANIIGILRKEVLGSNLLEVFLESAPQFILQAYIILKTGNATISQVWSLPISFMSLSYGSSKLYFSQRLGQLADESPCLLMTGLATIFCMILIMPSLFSYILFAVYFQYFVLIVIFVIITVQFVLLKWIFLSENQKKNTITPIYNNRDFYGDRESKILFLRAILTSWVSPCTVWIPNTRFLPISSFINVAIHSSCLVVTICFSVFTTMFPNSSLSVIHCIKDFQNYNQSEYRYTHSNNISNVFQICNEFADCLPLKRICSENELPSDKLVYTLTPMWIALIVISFLSSLFLYSFGSYTNIYRKTNFICSRIYLNILKEQTCIMCEENVMNKIKKSALKLTTSDYRNAKAFMEKQKKKKFEFKDLKCIQSAVQENSNKIIWQPNSPMHNAALIDDQFKLCFMNILGGHWSSYSKVKNYNEPKSCIDIITEREEEVRNSNWWIRRAIKKYKLGAHGAVKRGDIFSLELMIANSEKYDDQDENGRTPLWYAVEKGNLEIVIYLSETGADINAIDKNGEAPIHKAAINGHLKIVEYLTEKGAEINAINEDGNTPIQNAAIDGNWEIVKFLTEKGGEINAIDKIGRSLIQDAALCGNWEIVKYLTEKGAEINAIDKNGKTPIHIAASYGHLKIVQYLTEKGAEINAIDKEGKTPIHNAAIKGNWEIVKYLTEKGADINAIDKNGETPIHKAAFNGNLDIVKYLTEKGAEINAIYKNGEAPIHISANHGNWKIVKYLTEKGAEINVIDKNGRTLIQNAAYDGNWEIVKCLTENGAKINAIDNYGVTSIHLAAINGKWEIVKYLTENGAEINAIAKDGKTPIHFAANGGNWEIVKYLTEKGAEINAIDKDGEALIHKAAFRGHLKIVEYLTEKGADINAIDKNGETPIHVAAIDGNWEIVKYLTENGADINVIDKNGEALIHKAAFWGELEIVEYLIEKGADINANDEDGKTPIHIAEVRGHLKMFEYLTQKGAELKI